MRIYSCPNSIRNIAIILFIVGLASFLFAQEQSLDLATNRGYVENRGIPETKKGTVIFRGGSTALSSSSLSWQEEKNLSELQKQARSYRAQGLELQRIGNMDAAMSLYQKAIELDPAYPVAYNDLGIIYEAKGLIDRAEESYLKAIKIDPNYSSAYTNLALLYENERDLNKAAFYWEKRTQFGSPDDPWTQKAKQRLEDIHSVSSKRPFEDTREQEIVGLMKDVAYQKSILREDHKALARDYFEKAKRMYKKGDKLIAYKIASDANQLDPSNTEIEKFIEKVQKELLSR